MKHDFSEISSYSASFKTRYSGIGLVFSDWKPLSGYGSPRKHEFFALLQGEIFTVQIHAIPFKHALIFYPNLHAKSEKTVADPGGDKIGHPIPFPTTNFWRLKKRENSNEESKRKTEIEGKTEEKWKGERERVRKTFFEGKNPLSL